MGKQVLAIYAGINGYLDDYPPGAVSRYEKALYKYVDEVHPEALKLVNEKKALDDEVEGAFIKALDGFKSVFKV